MMSFDIFKERGVLVWGGSGSSFAGCWLGLLIGVFEVIFRSLISIDQLSFVVISAYTLGESDPIKKLNNKIEADKILGFIWYIHYRF